jgi:tetratricopeptide (TPR) repeat protein
VEAGRAAVAIELAEAALTEHRATGDRRYEADSLNVLGTAHQRGGDLTAATECHRQALEISRRIGVHRHEVVAMIGLARCADDPGRLEATEHARAAVDLARGDGLRLLEGPALTALATVLLNSGDLTTATEQAEQALAVQRETNQRLGQARALEILGEVAAKRGAHDRAVQSWRRAQRLYEEAGVPEARALHQVIEQSAR